MNNPFQFRKEDFDTRCHRLKAFINPSTGLVRRELAARVLNWDEATMTRRFPDHHDGIPFDLLRFAYEKSDEPGAITMGSAFHDSDFRSMKHEAYQDFSPKLHF